MDIGAYNFTAEAEEGATLELKSPNGKILRMAVPDDAPPGTLGVPFSITMRGRLSEVAQRAFRSNGKLAQERAKHSGLGNLYEPSDEDNRADNINLLVAVVTGWSWDKLNGEDFPFSPENARKFFADPKFRAFYQQALNYFTTDGNFTKG